MKIEIHSLKSIEARAMLPFASHTILISMGDTNEEPLRLQNKPGHILRLEFDDITLQEIKEEFDLPESVASSDVALIEMLRIKNIHIFSDKQARQIAEFVLRYNSETELLICQCHYGQSRSAGCAAAITEYFNGDGIDIFANDRYYPNKLVYRKVIKALEECESEQVLE
jgi:predicted protein tyrosine phosphatase